CSQNLKVSREFLESLGFILNFKKSNLDPSTSCKFLGFIFNSQQMTIELTKEKRNNLHDLF
ncbi:GSCOCG00011654001-RA-CDS, partial [Cotesia congregata]